MRFWRACLCTLSSMLPTVWSRSTNTYRHCNANRTSEWMKLHAKVRAHMYFNKYTYPVLLSNAVGSGLGLQIDLQETAHCAAQRTP
jgi:hypothetical protein